MTVAAAVKKRKGNEWKARNRTVKKAVGDDGEKDEEHEGEAGEARGEQKSGR